MKEIFMLALAGVLAIFGLILVIPWVLLFANSYSVWVYHWGLAK